MSTNYVRRNPAESVVSPSGIAYTTPESDPSPTARTRRCPACYGSGVVLVHGEESDCIDCEGFGDVLI